MGGGEGTQGGKGAGACSGKQSSQIKYKNKKCIEEEAPTSQQRTHKCCENTLHVNIEHKERKIINH